MKGVKRVPLVEQELLTLSEHLKFMYHRRPLPYWYRFNSGVGTVAVVIASKLDLQLHMQSVHITTNVVSSNPTQAMCTRYNIM